MQTKILSPIVLFVYNRPVHTRRTVEALQKNLLAQESDLIIFSDAPKKPGAADAVCEVREYICQIGGFKSIKIIERDKNWGLANSIIDGVTTVVNEYGRIIVLEDDLETSPYFLRFMNDALSFYQDEDKVMHISGYMFPINNAGLPDTFLLRPASCWGWATWSRAWNFFEKDSQKLLMEFSKQEISRFNMDDTHNYWEQVVQNQQAVLNTWAIFWYASVFQHHGLCLHPKISMVVNIGHDNSGVHCEKNNAYFTDLARMPVENFSKDIVECAEAHARTINFFLALKPSIIRRIYESMIRRLGLR